MKKFTYILYAALFIICFNSINQAVLAQNTNMPDQNCFFISSDDCFTIGYTFVRPHVNQPGESQNDKLDIELLYKACSDVKEIKITPTQGGAITIIPTPGVTKDIIVVVNGKSFKDGKLKVTITYASGAKTTVDIIYTGEECGAINPLPIELTSFTGLATQSGINLNWSTASEENNSHFEIERSADGQEYNPIGKVNGHGNSSVALKYSFIDVSPLQGINYYRLKQVDLDERFAFSNTIAVNNDAPDALQLSLAPNPCRNGNCDIIIKNNHNATETRLELKDMAGKVVLTKLVRQKNGVISLSPNDLRNHKGLFILTATSGSTVVNQRVVLE